MTRFLKIVGSLFVAALIVSALLSFIDRTYIDDNTASYKGAYNIHPLTSEMKVSVPVLPDITAYSAQNIKNKLPEVTKGTAYVGPFEEIIIKLRADTEAFGEMQGRLDAVAVSISEGVYGLDTLYTDINDDEVLEKRGNNIFVLHVPILIEPDAHLLLQQGQKLYLNAQSGSLIYNFGYLGVIDAVLYGWDIEEDVPADFEEKYAFRPYVATWCGGTTDIVGSEVAYLGFHEAMSYGLTYTSCDTSVYKDHEHYSRKSSGHIIDSKFTNMYFGFYSHKAEDVVIIRNEYDDNIIYGIDPHDWSKNLIIAHNTVKNTREKHGIITSRGVHESYIFNNISENNKGSGIMLDRDSHDNVIAYNMSRNNGGDGLTFYESSKNISYQNKLLNNQSAGIRARNSWDIVSYKDKVNDNRIGLKLYTEDLLANSKTKNRDMLQDPYTKKASMFLNDVEMIGNENSHFQLTGIDSFKLQGVSFYKTPAYAFSGDFKPNSKWVFDQLLSEDSLLIENKSQ
ncbi:MAG: right-handed parallel beta-helix repeat-containing protein [Alphaproteobacteria bacterium]|nr:right-handed parallel beta-helix repeat-containing protein [Alphaproteobacteria bacterium]